MTQEEKIYELMKIKENKNGVYWFHLKEIRTVCGVSGTSIQSVGYKKEDVPKLLEQRWTLDASASKNKQITLFRVV